MRTFIAVVPPAPVVRYLRSIGAELRSAVPALRIERAEKLHFTLDFLGEKEMAWIDACRAALIRTASATAPFPVAITRLGAFPAQPPPRVLWAGSQPEENPALCSLAADIRRVCAGLGHVPDPKDFHPHITLSRVKRQLSPQAIERLRTIAFEPCSFTCTELCIIESILHQHGSEYRTLHTIGL